MITDEIRNELFQISNFVTRLLVENVDEETDRGRKAPNHDGQSYRSS